MPSALITQDLIRPALCINLPVVLHFGIGVCFLALHRSIPSSPRCSLLPVTTSLHFLRISTPSPQHAHPLLRLADDYHIMMCLATWLSPSPLLKQLHDDVAVAFITSLSRPLRPHLHPITDYHQPHALSLVSHLTTPHPFAFARPLLSHIPHYSTNLDLSLLNPV